jgi:ribonuclease P protein component
VQTFKKEERISIQKEIDLLFTTGTSFLSYPLRIVYVKKRPLSGSNAAVLISVPKKRFKRAVNRNRIKRLIRETYRLNKNPFLEFLKEKDTGVLIAFLYIGSEISGYKEMESAMIRALKRIKEKE